MRLLLATAVIATVAAGAFVLLEQQGPSSEEACDQLALVQHLDDTLATLDPLSIASASIQLRAVHERSPDAIRDDVGVLLALTEELVAAVQDAPGREEQAVEAVARGADLDAVAGAGTAVQAYARDICGIDLTRTTTPASIAPPPTPSTTSTAP